ncbi:MAG TPA: DUF3617 domain-containing protein [Allosphingosinicella sp.]|nr:DUF3617 domain-containing protein [Allosphingosinicella sp.]
MKTQAILCAAVLTLAACGSSGGDKAGEAAGGNGSAAAAQGGGGERAAGSGSASASGSPVNLQPGEWEMKMEVVNVKVEGLPEGAADGMKSQAGGINRTCMTPEEAKAPKGDVFTGDKAGNCKSEGFKWEGGRIAGKTICEGQGGTGRTVMNMDGRYTPQSIDMNMKSETEMMGKAMTMEMRLTGRRVGECTAATKGG